MSVELKCDFCGHHMESVAAKIYLAPILPNKALHSYQAAYSHYADACERCASGLRSKMRPRKRRENKENGKVTPINNKKRAKAR